MRRLALALVLVLVVTSGAACSHGGAAPSQNDLVACAALNAALGDIATNVTPDWRSVIADGSQADDPGIKQLAELLSKEADPGSDSSTVGRMEYACAHLGLGFTTTT